MTDDAPTVEAAREQLMLAFLSANGINAAVDALIAAVRSDALRGSADTRTAMNVGSCSKCRHWVRDTDENTKAWGACVRWTRRGRRRI
jgi:hypothetical protein